MTTVVHDLPSMQRGVTDAWKSLDVATVNHNAVRLRVMKNKIAQWHRHAASDELFYVLSGTVFIDTEHATHTLLPGQLLVVPAGMQHRARATGRATLLVIDQI